MELPAARRLFALDHGFPQPIIEVLADFTPDAALVRIDEINERMPDLDDWRYCWPSTITIARGKDLSPPTRAWCEHRSPWLCSCRRSSRS